MKRKGEELSSRRFPQKKKVSFFGAEEEYDEFPGRQPEVVARATDWEERSDSRNKQKNGEGRLHAESSSSGRRRLQRQL